MRGTVTLAENSRSRRRRADSHPGAGAFALTEDGAFEIGNVPAGAYVVTAQRGRLAAASQTVTVTDGGTAIANFEFNLSPVGEVKTVTATAVGDAATRQSFKAVTTVDSLQIAGEAPTTIGEALEREPGVANRSSAPAPAGPSSAASAANGCSSSRTASAPATSPHLASPRHDHRSEQRRAHTTPRPLLRGIHSTIQATMTWHHETASGVREHARRGRAPAQGGWSASTAP